MHLGFGAVIHLAVSKDVVLERLLKRSRDDDKESAISQKFKEYDQKTQPVLEYLKNQGITVHEVDGDATADVVQQRIEQVLEK